MSASRRHAATACVLAFWVHAAAATTWDAARDLDFDATTNPNGVWSYGYDPAAVAGYQLRLFDQRYVESDYLSWRDRDYQWIRTPLIGKNITDSPIVGVQPGQLMLHPGGAPDGDHAILRFTAPSTGSYRVDARFFEGEMNETEAWVVLDGRFDAPLASLGLTYREPKWTPAPLTLQAGATLDFVVGNAGNFINDTTPLSVTISAVPAPASVWAMLAGLCLLGCAIPPRRRRSAG